MAHDDSSSVTLPKDSTPASFEGILVRLADHNRNKIAPIALQIDCEALRRWSEVHEQERFRYQNMVKELKLWSGHLARRPMTHLWLVEPFCVMDAPNLIDFIQATGHYLKVPSRGPVERSVTLSPRSISKQNIVLLTALKFNHVRVRMRLDDPLDHIGGILAKLVEHKFAYTSVVLENAGQTLDKMRLMEILSLLKPETLAFSHFDSIRPTLQERSLTAVLMQFGYYLHPSDVIMRFRSKLNNPPQDCLRLGPDSTSVFGNWQVQNHKKPDSYFLCLNRSILPLSV